MVATFTHRPDLIQVTYKVLSEKLLDPEKKAKEIALGQTTAAWAPTDPAGQKKLLKLRGTVLGIDERTHAPNQPYEYHLTIGYSTDAIEGDLPGLLSLIFGRVSVEGTIRLESVQLPEPFLKGKGPRFGIEGLREKLLEPDKPLILADFKPGIGWSPTDLAGQFYELASGGARLVRDNETLSDLPVCPTEKRLEACLKSAERAKAETGQITLYAVNLTGPVSKIPAMARKLAKEGAFCFLFNALTYGYGILEELSAVGVPILVYPALAGALGGSPTIGMTYSVILGTLMRLAGADIVLFASHYGNSRLRAEETRAIKERLTWSEGPLRKSFPAPMEGIYPGTIPQILQDFGQNVAIATGALVHDHPQGPRAGVKAFRQAIQWVTKRGNFGGISQREFPELAQALQLWGKK